MQERGLLCELGAPVTAFRRPGQVLYTVRAMQAPSTRPDWRQRENADTARAGASIPVASQRQLRRSGNAARERLLTDGQARGTPRRVWGGAFLVCVSTALPTCCPSQRATPARAPSPSAESHQPSTPTSPGGGAEWSQGCCCACPRPSVQVHSHSVTKTAHSTHMATPRRQARPSALARAAGLDPAIKIIAQSSSGQTTSKTRE